MLASSVLIHELVPHQPWPQKQPLFVERPHPLFFFLPLSSSLLPLFYILCLDQIDLKFAVTLQIYSLKVGMGAETILVAYKIEWQWKASSDLGEKIATDFKLRPKQS